MTSSTSQDRNSPHTAQNASAGDVIEREYDGNRYEFRVREGGHRDSVDNKFVYLDNPHETPLPTELYFRIEANEAWVMYENTAGNIRFYDPDEF